MKPRFALGDRVRITDTVVKHRRDGDEDGPDVAWKPAGVPSRARWHRDEAKDWHRTMEPLTEGVIVGLRFLTEYDIDRESEWDMWSGKSYVITTPRALPGTTRRAWLVAFDLRRKPVLVLDEDVEPVETPIIATSLTHDEECAGCLEALAEARAAVEQRGTESETWTYHRGPGDTHVAAAARSAA